MDLVSCHSENQPKFMDITFNCPNCNQELEVDAAGAGSTIECPSCKEEITIPAPKTPPPAAAPAPKKTGEPSSAMSSSAAAKVEMHLKVPVHAQPTESLIEKPQPPLGAAAKNTEKGIKTKTIRRTECIEVGHDKFDEVVTNFLVKIGEPNLISISPITYTHVDIGTQKILTEYGVLIVYRG